MSKPVSITVVGSIGIDTIETPFGQAEKILGGSAPYFSLAAANYTPVNLVAVVGEDFPSNGLDSLSKRGVDLTGLLREPGETFRWGGRYHLDFNTRETLFTELGVLGTFQPKVPESYGKAEIVFLANLQPTVQHEVVLKVPLARLRALDTMNFWLTSAREDLTRVLSDVDIVFMAEDEVRQFAGVANLRQAARAVLDLGPQVIIIKLGSYGALLIEKSGGYFAAPGFPLDDVRDPTGAGDSFAGGFLGFLAATLSQKGSLESVDYKRALLHGNIMGAFACEAFGVERLTTLTADEIAQRYRDLISFTHFESGV